MHIRLTFQDGHKREIPADANPESKAALIGRLERLHGPCQAEELVMTPNLAQFGVG